MRQPSIPLRAARALFVLAALAFLLPACAARQDNAAAELLDPRNSARQEVVADIQLNAGRARLALEGYDKALLARPADAGLLVKRGQALLRLNRPEPALEAFHLAQAASPDSPGAHYGAGQAAERLGRSGEARQAYERAVALAPQSWRARCHLGVVLMNQGHAEQAREQFLAALALPQVQSRSGTGRGELLNNLAVAQVLSGDSEGAVASFRQALRHSPDPERSANNLGLLLVRLGRQAEALEAFRAGGNDARALNNLGYALYLQGEVARAQALFEKALDLSPAYYETAGENLKQAVGGGPAVGAVSGDAGQDAGVSGAAGRGAAFGNAGEGAATPGVARLSLSGRPGQSLRFGPATLLGGGMPQRRTF